jgi:serine/threonine-protein kinase
MHAIPTQDIEAHRLYLAGREQWRKRTPVNLTNAVTYFEQAIARDPNYAQAYTGLADAYSVARFWGAFPTVPRDTLYARGKAAARRALELDSTLADAHSAMAELLCYGDWNWDGAIREVRRAIALDSNNATAHQRYAEFLAYTGHVHEALPEARTALRLEPLTPSVSSVYAAVLATAGQRDSAIAVWQAMLGRDSTSSYVGSTNLVDEYLELGRVNDAISMLRARHDTTGLDWDLVHASSDPASKRRAVAGLALEKPTDQIHPFLYLGMREAAFAALARAVAEHDERLERLGVFPGFAPMHGDPRYTAALRAINLAP